MLPLIEDIDLGYWSDLSFVLSVNLNSSILLSIEWLDRTSLKAYSNFYLSCLFSSQLAMVSARIRRKSAM